MSLWRYIREHMEDHLAQTVGEDRNKMTYEELIVLAENIADKLKGEKSCAIYCHSEMSTAIALMGCFAAEITAIPLSWRYGENHCKKILEFISPTCVITDWEGDLGIYHISDSQYIPPEENPALIMCTSGTTGTPKGVMLTEGNICTNVGDIAEYFDMNTDDKILISRPLYHCAVLTGEFLTSLIKGVQIEFCSKNFNPLDIIRLWKKEQISVFCGTPTLLRVLSRFTPKDKSVSLRHIVISGECMSESVGREIKECFSCAKIYHVYGLTEACPRVSYMPPEHFSEYPGYVGRPLKSVEIKIINPNTDARVKQGEKGILWVRGENIMMGYYSAPALSKKVLKDGWLCTGDIASIDDTGWLKIYGRNDDLIIRAGMNIYPQEIEAELKKDTRTKDVFIYGYNDSKYGVQIGMDISGDYKDRNEVHDLCKKILPSYQIPSKINLLSELRKSASGKVIRVKNDAGT